MTIGKGVIKFGGTTNIIDIGNRNISNVQSYVTMTYYLKPFNIYSKCAVRIEVYLPRTEMSRLKTARPMELRCRFYNHRLYNILLNQILNSLYSRD